MSRGRQYIQFEGYFAQSVPTIFQIIRGFADLRTGKLVPEIMGILKDAGAIINGGG